MVFELYKQIVKEEKFEKDKITGKEYIIMKILGRTAPQIANRLNKYMFFIDPDILRGLLVLEIKESKQMPRWIKVKGRTKDKLEELLNKYFRRFGIPTKILEDHYGLLRMLLVNDKNEMKIFLQELGEPKETFDAFGIELNVQEVKKEKVDSWF